jgi:hypothetical protein
MSDEQTGRKINTTEGRQVVDALVHIINGKLREGWGEADIDDAIAEALKNARIKRRGVTGSPALIHHWKVLE